MKTKDFNLNLQKYTSITILSDEVWDEYIKNCNNTPGHNVFKGALFHLLTLHLPPVFSTCFELIWLSLVIDYLELLLF